MRKPPCVLAASYQPGRERWRIERREPLDGAPGKGLLCKNRGGAGRAGSEKWRRAVPTFESEGAELYYESYGSGPPVVFCHGAGGNHISWFQQIPRLSNRYRCVTFDHRGWGRSLDPRPATKRPQFDEDLAALIDHLALEDGRLVAQSMGGWTALAYTVKHPDRVKALVMADTVGGLTSPELDDAREETRKVIAEKGLLEAALSEGFRKRTASGACVYEQIWGLNPAREEGGGRPLDFRPGTAASPGAPRPASR